MAKKSKSKVKSKPKDRLSIEEMKDRGLLQPGEEKEMGKIMERTKSREGLLKGKNVNAKDLRRVGDEIPETPYTYVGILATGGLGVVYLVAKKAKPGLNLTDRLYVAKHLLASTAYDENSFGRFKREGRILQKRLHPRIPHAEHTQFGHEDQEDNVIVSQFIAHSSEFDPTLAVQRKDGSRVGFSPMTLDDIFQTGVNALQIEHEIHEDAIATGRPKMLHRDIKPGNILHRRTEAWIVDLGTATAPEIPEENPERTNLNMTQTAMIEGTPNFLAPEVMLAGMKNKEGTVYVEPSEIYEWGATLYKVMTGRAPFEPEDPENTTQTEFFITVADYFHGRGPGPRPIRELNPLVPPKVEEIIMSTLGPKPESRQPQTVSELYHLLRAEVGTFPEQGTETIPNGKVFYLHTLKTVTPPVKPSPSKKARAKRKGKLKAAKKAAKAKEIGKTAAPVAKGIETTPADTLQDEIVAMLKDKGIETSPADTLQKEVDAIGKGGVEKTPADTLQRTVNRALNGEGERTLSYAGAEKTIALPSYTTVSRTLGRTYADPTRLLPYKPRKLLPAPRAAAPFNRFSRKPRGQK